MKSLQYDSFLGCPRLLAKWIMPGMFGGLYMLPYLLAKRNRQVFAADLWY